MSSAAPTHWTRRSSRGYALTERETSLLADGYRALGNSLVRNARKLEGMPQESDYLTRAAEAYQRALKLYTQSTTPAQDHREHPRHTASPRSDAASARRDEPPDPEPEPEPRRPSNRPRHRRRLNPEGPRIRGSRTVGVTVVSAADRDRRSTADSARRLDARHVVLAATSVFAVLAIALAVSGRRAGGRIRERSQPPVHRST